MCSSKCLGEIQLYPSAYVIWSIFARDQLLLTTYTSYLMLHWNDCDQVSIIRLYQSPMRFNFRVLLVMKSCTFICEEPRALLWLILFPCRRLGHHRKYTWGGFHRISDSENNHDHWRFTMQFQCDRCPSRNSSLSINRLDDGSRGTRAGSWGWRFFMHLP